ncbi:MAG: glycine--tRNA ligase subunit beta, partial [Rhodospirillales bacterium]|nr:glycine--tRNA ligase subunit beta [Rhodospirillales bacterium]
AVVGFAKSNGVSVDQLEIRDTGKGEYYFAVVKEDASQTIDYMPLIVSEAVFNMGWPKSMRWHSTSMTWIRPIQSILAVFDGKPLNDVFQLGLKDKIPGLKKAMNNKSDAAPGELEIPISNRTQGHRFLAPGALAVKDFADYRAKLKKANVLIDFAERRAKIERDGAKLARKEGLTIKPDADLLDECAGLVEWPVVLMGRIDETFMDLWPEVLATVMRHHQKYLALLDNKGNLAPRFLVVAGTQTRDRGRAIVAGNERVLKARLADAKYFRDQDLRRSLEDHVSRLDQLVFHARLGTMREKTDRIEGLAEIVGASIPGADPMRVRRAAHLCKADLVSQMVVEFPELQGVIGGRYAAYGPNHEDPGAATAIAEHYAPRGPGDRCPSASLSVAVALADKIDSLIGFWAVGERPTGSGDPFALRRAALGIIRLIVENDLRVPLRNVFVHARDLYGKTASELDERGIGELLDFFADRLKVHLRDRGVRHDHISAVFAMSRGDQASEDGLADEVDLVRILARVDALGRFLGTDDGADLLVAYRRASNIVRIEQKKDARVFEAVLYDPDLGEGTERELSDSLSGINAGMAPLLEAEKFEESMELLSRLRGPVDAFFDRVTVNVDDADVRENRLRLLARINAVMNEVADFSTIEG